MADKFPMDLSACRPLTLDYTPRYKQPDIHKPGEGGGPE